MEQTFSPAEGHYPWVPDQGDGTYRNPILFADYSDPDIVERDGDYFMTASSFNCTPGLPILHSRDLVNWTLVNHALPNLPHSRYSQVQNGHGVWAPSIRLYAERYWIFFPLPDEGIYVTTAADPRDKWSEPHLVQAGNGLIDPCPLWDDDGKAYLVFAYAYSRSGITHKLHVRPMAPDGSRLLGEGKIVFDQPDCHPTAEGPKFLKRDGWYYILTPAGGVATGWQLVLRSRHIYGPYEEKVVLEQGATPVNGPHQGGLIELPSGEWWFLHFQDAGVYGRITHLEPVQWEDGWPLMGIDRDGNGIGEPVAQHRKPDVGGSYPVAVPATSDDFVSGRLGLQWQWNANPRDDWYSLEARPGHLRLLSQPLPGADLSLVPNLLLQKFPARAFSVETALEFSPSQAGEQAGLTVMGRQYASVSLRSTETGFAVVFEASEADTVTRPVNTHAVHLRVEVQDGGLCRFFYAIDTDFVEIGEPFQAVQGHWIGARVGLYSVASPGGGPCGYVDFRYFEFTPPKN